MLHTQDTEGSWMRIVDAPAALSQRGYINSGEISITVSGDTLAPWNNNTWLLQVDGNEARGCSCNKPTHREAARTDVHKNPDHPVHRNA